MKAISTSLLAGTLALATVAADAQPLTPPIQRHVNAAKAAAGSEYEVLIRALCPAQAPAENISVQPEVRDSWYKPPARVFDNLYYVGQSSVSAWAIDTPDGIILVDALFEYSVEAEIVAGLRTVGLDPARIKYVIVLHGHRDHFGGAKYFQDRGASIVMSDADWAMVERASGEKPKRDVVVSARRKITLGNTTVDIVPTPGHTPGTISLIFPVKDGRRKHVAAIWGGTGFNTRDERQFRTYADSARMFAAQTRKAKVDVPLSNHPIVDHTFAKVERLQQRKPNTAHPFVTGWASQRNLLRTGSECAEAQLLALKG